MISFENTETAFESKTNKELKKADFLFRTLSKNTFVKIGKKLTTFAIKFQLPIKWIIKPTIYQHFVGGETIEECEKTIRNLEKYNVKTILDYSVEGEATKENIDKSLKETIKSITKAGKDKNIPFAVFKPTAFAENNILEIASKKNKLSENEVIYSNNFIKNINLLCKTAYENNVPILIDAEDFAYQKYIDDVILDMMKIYNKEKAIIFNTLQMYRIDRLEYLKKLLQIAKNDNFFLGIKFVRGAYMEKEREKARKENYPSPIQPDKESTDRDFNAALKFSIENIDKISIFNGTHNEHSSKYLTELMHQFEIKNDDSQIYFSQLYGMSDHISFNLAKSGYNVAKYVPYGPVKHVLPYLIRRAEENTSVAGQTGRELNLISKELKRRKKK